MRSLARFFATASRGASFLTLAAVVILLIKVIFLNRVPAAFDGAQELGVLVEAVLTSVVASYVFYLVVVHVKERTDHAAVHPYVYKHSMRVVGDCIAQLDALGKSAGTALVLASTTLDEVTAALARIPVATPPPLRLTPDFRQATWMQYFSYYSGRSRGSIARVLSLLPFINSRLAALLTQIDDCAHFSSLEVLQGVPVNNQTLADFAPSFYRYCESCRELKSYLHAVSSEEESS